MNAIAMEYRPVEGADASSPPDASKRAHAVGVDEICGALRTDAVSGLAIDEVPVRRARFGWNRLAEPPAVSRWRKLVGQFTEPIVLILIAAAVVAALLGEWLDTTAILSIVLLNGIIGFFQEERAQRELAALRKRSEYSATVTRGGRKEVVPADQLVPGDLIELEAGDHVPADCRLVESFGFAADEAALTGESTPVQKNSQPILAQRLRWPTELTCPTWARSPSPAGRMAVVVATSMRTELGRIADLLQRQPPEPTPLQKRLAELGGKLLIVVLLITGVIFALQVIRGGALLDVFLISVSLAVAAIPEGLPALVTLVLAVGLRRLVTRNALIRRLPSVETLGCVTVICSDKTGTLTRNEMTVEWVAVGNAQFAVTGAGYSPHGDFILAGGESRPASDIDLRGAPSWRLLQSRPLGVRRVCSDVADHRRSYGRRAAGGGSQSGNSARPAGPHCPRNSLRG